MCYLVCDTETCSTVTFDALDDAVEVLKTQLQQQEGLGRVVTNEPEGRWAIYDGMLVKMLWVETELGAPIRIEI